MLKHEDLIKTKEYKEEKAEIEAWRKRKKEYTVTNALTLYPL